MGMIKRWENIIAINSYISYDIKPVRLYPTTELEFDA